MRDMNMSLFPRVSYDGQLLLKSLKHCRQWAPVIACDWGIVLLIGNKRSLSLILDICRFYPSNNEVIEHYFWLEFTTCCCVCTRSWKPPQLVATRWQTAALIASNVSRCLRYSSLDSFRGENVWHLPSLGLLWFPTNRRSRRPFALEADAHFGGSVIHRPCEAIASENVPTWQESLQLLRTGYSMFALQLLQPKIESRSM
jgi:hypothetical protein